MQQEEERSFRRPSFTKLAPGHILVSIVVSLVSPYMFAAEYSQRGTPWVGLLLSALFPLGMVIYALVRRRVLDVVGLGALIIILANVLVSMVGASISDYALFHALAWAIPIALLGLVTLLSPLVARPLLYYADRFFSAGDERRKLEQYDAIWARNSWYRARLRGLNLLWGLAQIGLALIMGSLPFLLSDWPDQYSLLLVCVAYIVLAAWTQQRKSSAMKDDGEA